MTFGGSGGLTRPQLLPGPCAMDGPLSAYLVPPGYLAAAGVVDRPAYGLADTTPAALARMSVQHPAACSRRSRRAPPSGSCRTPGTAARHLGVEQQAPVRAPTPTLSFAARAIVSRYNLAFSSRTGAWNCSVEKKQDEILRRSERAAGPP